MYECFGQDELPCSHPGLTSLKPAMGLLIQRRRVTKGGFSPYISTTWYSISPLGQDEEDATDHDYHSCIQLYPSNKPQWRAGPQGNTNPSTTWATCSLCAVTEHLISQSYRSQKLPSWFQKLLSIAIYRLFCMRFNTELFIHINILLRHAGKC